jgi:catechol 2,3-dioxygenase-like lactoylglutathione lyase family enzyme
MRQGWRMELHRGRLIDHVHLVVSDLAASKQFYGAIFDVLGVPPAPHAAADSFGYDELYVSTTKMSAGHELTGRIHLAFATRDKALVERAYRAGLAAGGRDNGAPGDRPYHPGYFAGFLLDPDGNNIEIVFHGSAQYSADSVAITF